ncbi:hypothetical protein AAC387_Pa06g1211 [Persea americana]
MAGTLPGVELARRRRIHPHHEGTREPWIPRPRCEPSTTALGETVLRARMRLEQKLRGSDSSRWSKKQSSKGGGSKIAAAAVVKETGGKMVSVETGCWDDVCAVCLDEFQVQQPVMNLPCSHRYHSGCLLPWLNVHSHCPYCRTHVQS